MEIEGGMFVEHWMTSMDVDRRDVGGAMADGDWSLASIDGRIRPGSWYGQELWAFSLCRASAWVSTSMVCANVDAWMGLVENWERKAAGFGCD